VIQQVAQVYDPVRIGRSQWNRCEGYADANRAEGLAEIEEAGQAALYAGRPRVRYGGKLLDVPGSRLDVHWSWGDKVAGDFFGEVRSGVIEALALVVAGDNAEEINTRIDGEEVL
jgi:hypothetical protein